MKVYNKKVETFGFHNCEMVWAQDGSYLLISGNIKLKRVERSTWSMKEVIEFGHKS